MKLGWWRVSGCARAARALHLDTCGCIYKKRFIGPHEAVKGSTKKIKKLRYTVTVTDGRMQSKSASCFDPHSIKHARTAQLGVAGVFFLETRVHTGLEKQKHGGKKRMGVASTVFSNSRRMRSDGRL
jgi:hypothetical protein